MTLQPHPHMSNEYGEPLDERFQHALYENYDFFRNFPYISTILPTNFQIFAKLVMTSRNVWHVKQCVLH